MVAPTSLNEKCRRGDYQSPAITKKRWKFENFQRFCLFYLFIYQCHKFPYKKGWQIKRLGFRAD